jgi:hypothetical protein
MEYLNRGVTVDNWQEPLALGQLSGPAPDAFIVHPSRHADLAAIQAAYPGGTLVEIADCGVPTLYHYAFRLPPKQSTQDAPPIDLATLNIQTSPLDMANLQELFDHNPETLIRGSTSVNPLVLEIDFLTPRTFQLVELTVASMDLQLDVEVTPTGGAPQSISQSYTGLEADPTVRLALPGGPTQVQRLRLSITQLSPPPDVNIHVRELAFR